MRGRGRPNTPWWKRVGWLVIIWRTSVLVLYTVVPLLHLLMSAAGMKSH
ncbi:DUF2474 domain-containing protein [Serratia symbiotica]|nr:DUF2474 domain-containing protein [Serratia symbiotica]NIH12218.1 DUF2474 domain-containing protein [Serratia symbiotica]